MKLTDTHKADFSGSCSVGSWRVVSMNKMEEWLKTLQELENLVEKKKKGGANALNSEVNNYAKPNL